MGEKSVKTCFICASTISRNSEERLKETNVNTSRKILLKYLLKNRDKSETLYKTIENYVSKVQKDFCSVQFCASCDQRAEKVGRLLLKLSNIQKNIDEEIEETRRTVGDASKTISTLPKTDGSTRAKTKYLNTLRNFQKCVGNKAELETQGTDSLSIARVGSIQIDDSVIKSESHETIASIEIAPQPENTSANEEVIHDSTEEYNSNESNDEDEYTVDYIKVEDEDDCIMVEHDNDDQDLSDEEEEEIIDCNTDFSSPFCPIDPLLKSFDDSEDSDCIVITENNDGSHTRPPPPSPIVKIPNKASSPSPNFSKESVSQIHVSSSTSSYVVNTNPSMEKVRRLAPNSSRNIPLSTVVPLQNPHHTLQQYVVVTPLQSSDGRALPPPKIFPLKYKSPPEVKNVVTTRKLANLQAPSKTIPVEPGSSSENCVEGDLDFKRGKKLPIFGCTLCVCSVMKSNISFEHHLKTHETSTKNYTCSMCKMQFTTKQMHDYHNEFHNDLYSTKCDICRQQVRVLEMKEHLETHHQVISISCPYCCHCFGKYYGLLCHLKLHSITPLKCVICPDPDSVFQTRRLLANHFIEFHEIDEADVIIKCDDPACTATFFDGQYKTLHMQIHQKTYECPTCGKCLISALSLKEHSKIHTEEGLLYPCDLCPGKAFIREPALLSHQRKEHGVPKLQCDQCDKTFLESTGLKYHQKFSHGVGDMKQHPCPICGKKLLTKAIWNTHMRSHSETKDFICSECGFQTKSKALLKHHELRHFGEKTHKCPYCPKVFLTSGILKVHVRVHTKERPYVCDICGSDFNQRSAMMSHKKRHADSTFVPRGSKPRKKEELIETLTVN